VERDTVAAVAAAAAAAAAVAVVSRHFPAKFDAAQMKA